MNHQKNYTSSRRSFIKKSSLTVPAIVLGTALIREDAHANGGGVVAATIGTAIYVACRSGSGICIDIIPAVFDAHRNRRYSLNCQHPTNGNPVGMSCGECRSGDAEFIGC